MTNTHLGVPSHELVLLESIGVSDFPDPRQSLAFFKTKYDAGLQEPSGGTFGYSAPKRKAIIITEVDWQYESGKAGENVTLRIFLEWPPLNKCPERRVLESTILLGSNGGGGVSTSETTGIVVLSGVKITVDVTGSGATGKIQHVLLRGYLTGF